MSERGPTSNRPASAARRRRVLVVDDDKTITRMLEVMFQRTLHVDVRVANIGFGLLNIIASDRPDVVLLDVMMPGLDGESLTRLIRTDADLAHTRVVLFSAMDESTLAKLAQTCGADDFMQKGLRPTEIARRIRRFLAD